MCLCVSEGGGSGGERGGYMTERCFERRKRPNCSHNAFKASWLIYILIGQFRAQTHIKDINRKMSGSFPVLGITANFVTEPRGTCSLKFEPQFPGHFFFITFMEGQPSKEPSFF